MPLEIGIGKRLHYFIAAVVILLPSTFFICYGIALSNQHVNALWPYISDTGTLPPESCVFGQLVNICALLFGIVIYIRYCHVAQVAECYRLDNVKGLNYASLIVGLLGALGMSMVANFQVTDVFIVHMIGASLCFGLGIVYCIIQTIISFREPCCSNLKRWSRLLLTTNCCVSFVCCAGYGFYAEHQLETVREDGPAKGVTESPATKWRLARPGYDLHTVSTVAEWVLGAGMLGFVATHWFEFKALHFHRPVIHLRTNTGCSALNTPVSPPPASVLLLHTLPTIGAGEANGVDSDSVTVSFMNGSSNGAPKNVDSNVKL